MLRSLLPLAVGAAVVFALPSAARAAYSTDSCTGTIASLPAVISTQGTWCLTKDLSTPVGTGAAIDIQAHNVTIDCNGFKLGGLGAGASTSASGIRSMERMNVTVRNCHIRGFNLGIEIEGWSTSAAHRIAGNRFDGNTVKAIQVRGDGSIIRDNQVMDTGGSSLVPAFTMGIHAIGDVIVDDNVVQTVAGPAEGSYMTTGIHISQSDTTAVRGNVVQTIYAQGSGTVNGIYIEYGGGDVRGNTVGGIGYDGTGIRCESVTSWARDNFVQATTPVFGCRDGGGQYGFVVE